MVYVPAGYFLMGSTPEDGAVGFDVGVDEFPQRRVYLKTYYIDQFEVTNGQWLEYMRSTKTAYMPAYWKNGLPPPGQENHPVTDTDWYDADAYCRWAGKRLPTEEEWEKAARGSDGRHWPWGNQHDLSRANTLETGRDWAEPVGSHPEGVSPYGAHDMAGHVWEWTSSWYQAYPGNQLQRGGYGEHQRVARGGSWHTPLSPFARSAHRYTPDLLPMDQRDENWHTGFDKGFRCVKDR
ncbi:MAG: SUMF1/EgtB/PvdO family nonheme iron enzyme [Nitrospirota bacterium]